jgi:hypothetical protein
MTERSSPPAYLEMATEALSQYEIGSADIQFIGHSEHITFRAQTEEAESLQPHRP